MRDVFRVSYMRGPSFDSYVILGQYPIVKQGKPGSGFQLSVTGKPGCLEQDIVGLPFAWLPAGIDQWAELFINNGTLSVNIGEILVTIHYLHFVTPGQKDDAVSPPLCFDPYLPRCTHFHVQLTIPKKLPGKDPYV